MKTSLLFLAGLACLGQTPDQGKLLAAVKVQAQNYAQLLFKGEYAKAVDLTHPPVVELFGGKEKMVQLLEGMKGPRLKPSGVEAALPKEIHKAGKTLVAIVPLHFRFQIPQGKFVKTDHLLASSADGGKTWINAPATIQSKTTISSLPSGSTVMVRYLAVTAKGGQGDWSQPTFTTRRERFRCRLSARPS